MPPGGRLIRVVLPKSPIPKRRDPHTGKAVGLELQGDARLIGPFTLDLLCDTELMLDVMTNLVGEDVGLGSVTGRPESSL